MAAQRYPCPLRLTLLLPLLLAAVTGVTSAQEIDRRLASLALELLESAEAAAGPLALSASVDLAEGDASRPDLVAATLVVDLPAAEPAVAGAAAPIEVAIAVAVFDSEPELVSWSGEPQPAAAGSPLRLRLRLEVALEMERIVVAVGRGGDEAWGACEAVLGGPPPAGASRPEIEADLRPALAATPPAILRLLPPTRKPVTGEVRIRVLLSDVPVARVRFELDGEPVAEDDSAPFAAVIDFGDGGETRVLRAVAYDAAGRELGDDRIAINETALLNRVRIRRVEAASGRVEVAAELELAAGNAAERVEFFLNQERVETLTAPPWSASMRRDRPQPTDFVRVVAHLGDGSVLEDARLVEGTGERVEVNLVQVFAVVTDRDGTPRRDLGREDFRLELQGRQLRIDRFAPAQEVPLVLGLVIDTSVSMWALMPDTRVAGSRFLADTLRAGDRAFLVDFDTRPRLAAGLTGDVGALLRRFAGLTADGFTALYDAVIFSMLQFEHEAGRKALVVLTDGDDYKSRFGARRCIEYGRELGVPVYIIALGGLFGERRDLRKLALESLSGSTGGRVFYITGREQLGVAYEQIAEELRSQYLLAFTRPRPLSAEELAAIRVHVRGRGLRVRAVTPSRRP